MRVVVFLKEGDIEMTLVKKVDPTWSPSENHALQVGEVIDITDPGTLLANGTVELYVEPEPQPVAPLVEVKSTKTKKGGELDGI